MKAFLITYTLVAAMTAVVAMPGRRRGPNRAFNTTLKADAIEVLAANGTWAPKPHCLRGGRPQRRRRQLHR